VQDRALGAVHVALGACEEQRVAFGPNPDAETTLER